MQVFLWLSTHNAKRKFQSEINPFLESFPGFQRNNLEGTGWDAFTCLIPVETAEDALALRKEVTRRLKVIGKKIHYFRVRKKHVDSIFDLTLFGLTKEETKAFNEKAPPGVHRHLDV